MSKEYAAAYEYMATWAPTTAPPPTTTTPTTAAPTTAAPTTPPPINPYPPHGTIPDPPDDAECMDATSCCVATTALSWTKSYGAAPESEVWWHAVFGITEYWRLAHPTYYTRPGITIEWGTGTAAVWQYWGFPCEDGCEPAGASTNPGCYYWPTSITLTHLSTDEAGNKTWQVDIVFCLVSSECLSDPPDECIAPDLCCPMGSIELDEDVVFDVADDELDATVEEYIDMWWQDLGGVRTMGSSGYFLECETEGGCSDELACSYFRHQMSYNSVDGETYRVSARWCLAKNNCAATVAPTTVATTAPPTTVGPNPTCAKADLFDRPPGALGSPWSTNLNWQIDASERAYVSGGSSQRIYQTMDDATCINVYVALTLKSHAGSPGTGYVLMRLGDGTELRFGFSNGLTNLYPMAGNWTLTVVPPIGASSSVTYFESGVSPDVEIELSIFGDDIKAYRGGIVVCQTTLARGGANGVDQVGMTGTAYFKVDSFLAGEALS